MVRERKPLASGGRKKEWLFYGSLVLLSIFVFLLLGESGYVLFDDSPSYMNFYANMEGVMPIYPFFLHGNKLLFGEERYLYAVIVEQAVIASICVILFTGMIKKRFRLKYWEAYVCYGLTLMPFTTNMPEAMTTHEILTEGLAYAVFYLFMAALMFAVWDKSFKWLGVSCLAALFLSLIRSQLQILFGVCGVICIYIVLLCRSNIGMKKWFLRILCGLAGCMIISLAGVVCVGKISSAYQQFKDEARKEQQEITKQQEAQEQPKQQESLGTEREDKIEKKKPELQTSQYVSLIFSRGMYEADAEDYLLFEDEMVRELYLVLYPFVDREQCRYVYAAPGLWMWKDIVGGIGSVGRKCFYVQNEFYQNNYPELAYSGAYSTVRNNNQIQIGLTLIKAHFGRFLYHTAMLLPQAFICTVFFQIKQIYLLCHLVTLFLYLSAAVLMIWAYRDKKVGRPYGELMCAVLGTNLVMVLVISLVFFGQQRYLVYNFGIFYIAYFLLFMQLWKLYGRELLLRIWNCVKGRGSNGE